MATFSIAGGITIDKDPGQLASYTFKLDDDLAPGDSITGVAWTIDAASGLTNIEPYNDQSSVTCRLGGGNPGVWLVGAIASTAEGDELAVEFRVNVSAGSTLGAGIVSCFPSLSSAVGSIRRDRLMTAAGNFFPGEDITDDYILEKLVASEADIQRQLRCYLSPREVMPMTSTADQIAATEAGGNTVLLEPGYDYTPAIFEGNTWGLMELRQRPVSAVRAITFNYPAPTDTLFTIPAEWIRYEPRYGRVNLVPVQTALSLPLNAFILSALGGGRNVPLMLQVTYRAGVENASVDYPDALDVIKKATVLNIIDDRYVPSSGSISQDGLSQSISMDIAKYGDTIERKIGVLRRSLNGPMIMVM